MTSIISCKFHAKRRSYYKTRLGGFNILAMGRPLSAVQVHPDDDVRHPFTLAPRKTFLSERSASTRNIAKFNTFV